MRSSRFVVIHLQELKNAQAIRHLGALRAIYALGYMVEFYSKEDRKLSESTFLYQPRSHEHIEAVEENLKQLSYQLKSLSSELREEVVR